MSLAALSEHDLAHWRGSARRAQAALATRLFIDGQFAIANDTIYGLAAGVWTRDIDVAFRLVREIEAGVIWINSFDEGDMTQPFGGYKQSGQARDKCLDSFLGYTQTKSAWFRLASP
jgi:gamma-glutamyl-gamma-aminobutyraldehyde dehydrogenase